MNSVYETLTEAYKLTDSLPRPYTTEVSMILTMFISPERIESFNDDELYLAFVRTIIDNRENVSFPDSGDLFEKYYLDCIRLKDQIKEETVGNAFPRESWLDCCIRLLENLKTPYYAVYTEVLSCLKTCFADTDLFGQTLKAFYSVLIRSREDTLPLIQSIGQHGRGIFRQGMLKGQLLSDLMIHHLSVFADGKELWVHRLAHVLHMEDCRNKETLLLTWLGQEELFLQTVSDSGELPLSAWLSACGGWVRQNVPASGKPVRFISEWTSAVSEPGQSVPGYLRPASEALIRNLSKVDSHFLNTYAYNMNARSYTTNPAIGREQEIKDLELILISPKKSPVLIGESGVGKTSVVEGLAWLLQKGDVPDLLKNKTIFKLTTTSLLSGTKYVGEMEERIKQLTGELEKYPDVILFIDEIHTIVGAGSTESSHNDISNMLKPFIDRGDIKIIGATTIQEYEAYLLPDRALARRFYPIAIEEPDEDMTLKILRGTLPSMEVRTRVYNGFSEEETLSVMTTLIRLSDKKNQPEGRITRLPELPLTLLEMAFSYAALESRKTLVIEDIIMAVRHTNLLTKEVRMKAENYF